MSRFRFLLVAAMLVVPAFSYAQVTTATLVGVVSDASGGVLPGATVVATNMGTGVARQSVTDMRGEFVLTALPVGRYSVKIEMPSFKPHTVEGLALNAGQTVRQAFALDVGGVEEAVTVTASVPVILMVLPEIVMVPLVSKVIELLQGIIYLGL